MFEYRVVAINELLTVIIPFFRANALLTTKNLNFLDFERVMRLIEQKQHLTQDGLNIIRTIAEGMNTGRAYYQHSRRKPSDAETPKD